MGLYKLLRGTTEYLFKIGGPLKPQLKTDAFGNGEYIQVRNSDDDGYSHIEALNHMQGIVKNTNGSTVLDTRAYTVYINESFDGGSVPVWNDDEFYMCHTSGGAYTAGRVYYKHVDEANPLEVASNFIKFIITTAAISGTVSFEANWLYGWTGSIWEKKCDGAGGDPGKQYIAITIGTSASYSSTTVIPTGAVVTDIIADITTEYSSGGGVDTVEVNGNNIMSGTSVWRYVNQYVVEDVTPISTGDVATVNIFGSPFAGAGVVYVGYVTPNV